MRINKKIRVLLVGRSFPPIFQGEAVNHKILAENIDAGQIQLRILTSYWRGAKVIEDYGHSRVYRFLLTKTSAHMGSGIGQIKKYIFWLLSQLSYFFCVSLFILFFKIDVIHITPGIVMFKKGRYQNWIMQVLLKYLPVRVILDVRITNNSPQSQWAFDKIIYNSESILKELIEKGIDRGKTTFIPSPIVTYQPNLTSHLFNQLKKYVPYIGFVGAVSERKCIYELIDGFIRFSKKHPSYKLVIAGPNAEGDKFIRRISQYDNIIYLGMLNHKDALEVIKQCDLLVLPSKSEGVPRVCLEAMALGKKVILPPGIKEFEFYCDKFILSKNTPEAIALKMDEIITTDELPQYLPLAEMTMKNYVENISKLYKDIMRSKE